MADRFEYEGKVYARPIERGLLLAEGGGDLDAKIIELLGARYSQQTGWTGRMRITVEIVTDSGDAG